VATIAFTGQITASTGTNAAFNVTGGGTVTATNTNSTLTSTTGITLNMASVSVGAAGLTFKSVSSNGAANGIRARYRQLRSEGLNVIGDNNGRANGSGGSIANTTGGSLGNAPVHALLLQWHDQFEVDQHVAEHQLLLRHVGGTTPAAPPP